ncbi:MAG TPA: iron ABC transporter permease [Capillimicrobium sp.]|jgi:iron complex transport system permease protein
MAVAAPPTPQALAPPLRAGLRRTAVVVVGVVALLGAVAASLALGAVQIPLAGVIDVLGGHGDPIDREILVQLRFPRTVTAIAVGAALGVAGALLQAALANPLASPDVIGVTGGAGFGAMLVILLAPAQIALLPVSAMVFGLVAAGMVAAIAWSGVNRGGVGRLILAGIAVGAMFTAATSMLMALYPSRVPSAVMWLAGGLVSEGWRSMEVVAPYLVVALIAAVALVRPLNRLALGDDVAASLGARPQLIRLLAVLTAAVLASAAAALAGLLGFLGIVVPHAVRLAAGTSSNGYVVPVSALCGAALLTAGDVVARTIKAPLELPVGPMMVVLGVPLFLWLLRKAV